MEKWLYVFIIVPFMVAFLLYWTLRFFCHCFPAHAPPVDEENNNAHGDE